MLRVVILGGQSPTRYFLGLRIALRIVLGSILDAFGIPRRVRLGELLEAMERRIRESAVVFRNDLSSGEEGAPGVLLEAMERRIRDSTVVFQNDLSSGEEGAPGELLEAMERRIRDFAFVFPHDLTSGAEGAPGELLEAMERRVRDSCSRLYIFQR